MTLQLLVAALHLLALGIGLGAVWARARGLRDPLDGPGLKRVFTADALWGMAFGLWLVTGLARAFGGLEKGTNYYMQNHFFLTKMTLLAAILALEVRPMITLIRWRAARKRGTAPDTRSAPTLARISVIQAFLIVVMVFLAVGMARGIGMATG